MGQIDGDSFAKEGFSWCSFLSLLLAIFINDLLISFEPSSMLVSAYADDLALVCSSRSKDDVVLRLQSMVDKIAR